MALTQVFALSSALLVRPDPPAKARDVVVVVLDSCRFDSVVAAAPRSLAKLGELERRFSFASWTAPSHYNLLMGVLPHTSPRGIYASHAYSKSVARWADRLGIDDVGALDLLPRMWMPSFLRERLGFFTRAMVSMPVLNPYTPLAVDFDSWIQMPRHNDLGAMIDALTFDDHRPTFWLLNVGETHYPYAPVHEPEGDWPRIHGLHGVFRRLAAGQPVHGSEAPDFFDPGRMAQLHARQVDVVRHLDGLLERLFASVPPGTSIVVTADHGELFGEGGYFGHGPILHDKVFEVPFVEGRC